jgi:hypothetical protein
MTPSGLSENHATTPKTNLRENPLMNAAAIPFGQLLLAVSIPTIVAVIGVILNQVGYFHLSSKIDQQSLNLNSKIDRQSENFNNQVTTLLTTIHNVDIRLVKVETAKGDEHV